MLFLEEDEEKCGGDIAVGGEDSTGYTIEDEDIDNPQEPLSSSSSSSILLPCGYRYSGQLQLTVSVMRARDLVDKGTLFDAQDPMLRVTVAGVARTTDRQKDAGKV